MFKIPSYYRVFASVIINSLLVLAALYYPLELKGFWSEYERAMSVLEDRQYAMMAVLILSIVCFALGGLLTFINYTLLIKGKEE